MKRESHEMEERREDEMGKKEGMGGARRRVKISRTDGKQGIG